MRWFRDLGCGSRWTVIRVGSLAGKILEIASPIVLFCCDPREQVMIVIKFAMILTRIRERQDEGRWLGDS